MTKQAFFIQGDNLLLPADTPDSQIEKGTPLEMSKEFKEAEIFEIPAINCPQPHLINVVSVFPAISLPENWKSIPVRQVLAILANTGAASSCAASSGAANTGTAVSGGIESILRACHIVQWRRDSRFCGTCGAENSDVAAQAQRICPKCGRTEFPRICPAVIVVITDSENRILLAHNKRFRAGVYSHISGFNEAGETLEETVVREIREEINIEVNNIEYITSQAWPFPNSLMLGFKARHLSGVIQPDGDEIEDAKWFTKENLPDLPGEGSLSRFLINCWLNGTL